MGERGGASEQVCEKTGDRDKTHKTNSDKNGEKKKKKNKKERTLSSMT